MTSLPTYDLSSRYQLGRQMGSGLLGVVFEGLDRRTGKAIAAKLLTHVRPDDADALRREYEALGRLKHPHLATCIELVDRNGGTYLVTQHVDGLDLMTYLHQPPSPAEVEALREREDLVDREMEAADQAQTTGPIDEEIADEVVEDAASGDESEDEDSDASDESGGEDAAASDESADGEADASDEPTEETPGGDEAVDDEIQPETDEPTGRADEAVEALGDGLDLVLLRLERVLPQIVDALEHLHRFRKEHGNLKPTNIQVDPEGRCLLTDYGITPQLTLRREESDRAADEESTQSVSDAAGEATSEDGGDHGEPTPELPPVASPGVRFGPPTDRALRYAFQYRAPETLGLDDASPEADLYALGCVLFEAIAGQPPFEGSAKELHELHLEEEPRALSEIEPQCPASWADVIHGLLDKDPGRRPDLAEVGKLVEYSESYAVDIPPSAVPEQTFFFGRTDLIDEIVARIKETYQQKCLGVAMLRGPAGVGKTAISKAVSYLASRRGWLVLNGKCYQRESLIYHGWSDIAAQIADIYEQLPEDLKTRSEVDRRRAASLFPVLTVEDDPPLEADNRPSRLEAIDSFRRLLRRLSIQRPLLLVFDDLHWASRDTADLLLDLIGEPNGLRCMVLGTWLETPEDLDHPIVQGLGSAPGDAKWFNVAGFSKDEAREYVISAGSHLTLQEQQQVLKTGELNPLLLEELVHDLRPGEEAAEDIEELIETDREDQRAVVDKMTDVLEARLEELNRRERFVLEVLSVASIPLSRTIISTVVDEEFHSAQAVDNTAQDALNRLLEERYIQAVDSRQWKIAYTVTHNLYRRHVLSELRDQRYAHLCGRIAEGIRRCWPAAEELRFEYLLRADQARQAADAALRAARSAEKRHAYNRAARLWEWLRDNATHISATSDVNPLVEQARVAYLAQQYKAAARLYHEAVRDTEEKLSRARMLGREFRSRLRAAEHALAREAVARGVETLGESFTPRGLRGRLKAVKDRAVAATKRSADRPEEARVGALAEREKLLATFYEEIIDAGEFLVWSTVRRFRDRLAILAESSADAHLLGLDRLQMAREAVEDGSRRDRQHIENWLTEALSFFEQSAEWGHRGLTELCRVEHLRMMGEFQEAHQALQTAMKYLGYGASADGGALHLARLARARIEFARGDIAGADRLAGQALHFARNDRLAAYKARQLLVECALMAGQTRRFEELIRPCRDFLAETPVSLSRLWVTRVEARYNIALGRPEVAVGRLDVFADRMHEHDLFSRPSAEVALYLTLGQALAARVEREKVLVEHRSTKTLRRLKRSLRSLESHLDNVSTATHAAIGRLQARYHLLRRQPKKALRILDTLVERLVTYENPIEHARCLEARGYILRALDNPDAHDFIEQAQGVYEARGARLCLFVEGWPVPPGCSRLRSDES
ncbi:MAG: protein kinase domain-containing protein [Persicimonas sp.]